MPQSFTYREPWTTGVDRLAQTIGTLLDARNQRLLLEEKMKQAQFEQGRQKLADIENLWQNTGRPEYKPLYEQQAQTLGYAPPTQGFNRGAPQITTQAPTTPTVQPSEQTPEAIYSRLVEKGYHPTAAKMLTEKQIASRKETNVKPFDMNNPWDQFLAATQQVHKFDVTTPEGYRAAINWFSTPEAQQLWKEQQQKGFKFTGASVFRGEDNRWWRWNPNTGEPEFHANGKWNFNPKIPVPDAVVKELGRTPSSAIEKGVTLDQIAGNVERIRNNFNPGWVGPAAGRFYATQEALTGLKDNNQSMFYADVRDIGDMLLRARSGAQINEQEMKRLEKLVPTPNLPPKVFEERLNRFNQQFSQAIQAWERRLQGGRYISPKRSEQTQSIINNPNMKSNKIGRFTVEVE